MASKGRPISLTTITTSASIPSIPPKKMWPAKLFFPPPRTETGLSLPSAV